MTSATDHQQQEMGDVFPELTEVSVERQVAALVRNDEELNPEERQYLMSVEKGDIPTVLQLLQQDSIRNRLNRNCIDPFGRTALLIAIENDNIDMIGVLLRSGVAVGDALLHAISEDNVEATQLLLAHESTTQTTDYYYSSSSSAVDSSSNKEKVAKITAKWRKLTTRRESGMNELNNRSSDSQESLKPTPPPTPLASQSVSSSFSPDITPVIMAAHRDNYEILKILLDRGDRILKPHDVRCSCSECVTKSSEDSLNHSRSRINAYRALSSPSLIALSSTDPVLTAFELSWELRILSKLENELKVDYEKLAKQCEDFAVDLLDQVRGSKELGVLLNYNGSPTILTSDGDDIRMTLDRLKLAIKYKQKRFVANPSCQQLLASLWYEGLLGYRRRHVVFKVLLTVSVSVLFPVLSITYMIAPKTRIGQFIRRPFIKFICHSASYMAFLFLLILASQRIESIINLGGGGGESGEEITAKKMTREVRGAPPTSIEWMILIYVAGLIWAEIKQLWDQGLKSYIQDMWNILDFMTNALYIATFTLKLVAYLKVAEEKRVHSPTANLTREHWDAFDPTLISEGLFAAANIFSSLKLIYIFTVNPHLGPLQISLGRMVIDILKFLFIALLVCFSYSCGVNQLYWYYAEARNRDCTECQQKRKDDPGNDCNCDSTLSNLFEIVQTLYFAVYGLVDINHFELKEKHEFTQFVGKLMYGTYLGIMTIVLINMLIAMLSSSFQKISNDADTEWKFARSRLWMSYFDEGATVPPPFNIVPTPKTFWYLIVWLWATFCRCSKKARTNKWQTIRKSIKQKRERDTIYQAVMRELIKRYIMKRQRNENAVGVSEDDINEIKQDISSFRFELLEILRSNGMKINFSTAATNPPQNNSGRMRRKSSRMSLNKLCQEKSISVLSQQNSFPSPSEPSSGGAHWSPASTTTPPSAPSSFPTPFPFDSNEPGYASAQNSFTAHQMALYSFGNKVPVSHQRSNDTIVLQTLVEECAEEENLQTTEDSGNDVPELDKEKWNKERWMKERWKLTNEFKSTPTLTTDSENSETEQPVQNDDCSSSIPNDALSPDVNIQMSWPPTRKVSFQLKTKGSSGSWNEDLMVQSDDV